MKNSSIIDAHIHLWDVKHLDYPWLNQFPKINRTFSLSDYNKATAEQSIEKMIFVQAECKPSQFLKEVEWVQALSEKDERLSAIIPWAPLHIGNAVAEVLEKFAENPKIKGVRQLIQPEEDLNFCISPDFIEAVKLLGKNNLHFELTTDPKHFPAVLKLVEKCHDTIFILNHIGNPSIVNKQLYPWRQHLKAFANSGPHYCKFSNLVCNANLDLWDIDDLRPYSDIVIDVFGPEKLIWGSDWPHVLRASSWSKWFKTAVSLTESLSEEERDKVFKTNAIRFYNL
ncbi:amidohydrolase family protein [Seonamhaeicola aphaedonensis]|uniref:L-fuconolactonase n=1 Tax=Seonamhaeicola aphaedonensis TaxID=1461338 RepID=A0A3D9HLC4_9FLAO|nr:amidohydrolase family protein [Seonamhaeicola aphaedonensis]RED50111.1 L-fuconolactonase [Seonamhaeicola aphaedonensis]